MGTGTPRMGEETRLILPGFKMCCKTLAAGGTEHLLLAIKFVEGIGLEHDAFPVGTVIEAEEMADLMGPFLGDPVYQVIVAALPAIVLVPETGGRYYGSTDLLAGEAEDETVAIPEEILVDNEKDGIGNTVMVLVRLDTVKQCLCIDLFPADHISHHPDMIL